MLYIRFQEHIEESAKNNGGEAGLIVELGKQEAKVLTKKTFRRLRSPGRGILL